MGYLQEHHLLRGTEMMIIRDGRIVPALLKTWSGGVSACVGKWGFPSRIFELLTWIGVAPMGFGIRAWMFAVGMHGILALHDD